MLFQGQNEFIRIFFLYLGEAAFDADEKYVF